MTLSSPAFAEGGPIPARFTCDGADVSPPLALGDVPAQAQSLALIVDDPDAPRGTFVHWLVWNLPPTLAQLPEGVPPRDPPPALGELRQGTNDFHELGYRGPCPPRGEHRYRFHLYALDARLDLAPGARRDELERALRGHVLAEARLTGVYAR